MAVTEKLPLLVTVPSEVPSAFAVCWIPWALALAIAVSPVAPEIAVTSRLVVTERFAVAVPEAPTLLRAYCVMPIALAVENAPKGLVASDEA